jgi:hypothetical protein
MAVEYPEYLTLEKLKKELESKWGSNTLAPLAFQSKGILVNERKSQVYVFLNTQLEKSAMLRFPY